MIFNINNINIIMIDNIKIYVIISIIIQVNLKIFRNYVKYLNYLE